MKTWAMNRAQLVIAFFFRLPPIVWALLLTVAFGALHNPQFRTVDNALNVLDEVIVPVGSPAKTIADLAGRRIGSGPGIQNVTLAKTVLERGGAEGATVIELPIGQHVAALAAGQVDGCYTLEPTGTIGRLNGTTRVLETGVIARYVLGDPLAPWFGGSATLSGTFVKKHPEAAKAFITAYARGIDFVREHPEEARQYLKGYTAIEGALTGDRAC